MGIKLEITSKKQVKKLLQTSNMKTFFLSTAFLMNSVLADWETIVQTLTALQESTVQGEQGDRALNQQVLNIFNGINGYGCWCNFNENYTLSHGPVQDGIDQLCKRLVNGYHCGIMDGAAAGTPCQTNTQEYTAVQFNSQQTINQFCTVSSDNAGNFCKETACIVEGTFSVEMFADMFGGSFSINPNLVHISAGGIFDPVVECAYQTAGQGRSEKECCGEYPDRYPFKHFNNARQCCGQITYAVDSLQCCVAQDGSTSLVSLQQSCP